MMAGKVTDFNRRLSVSSVRCVEDSPGEPPSIWWLVAKVDELMALCDQLETSLTEGEQTRSRLLESVLHHALEPA